MIILIKKKRLWEMYPIGSPSGALNNKRTPKFIGNLKFKWKDDHIELNRFIVIKDGVEKFYPPSEAIRLLKKQAVFLDIRDRDMEEYLTSIDVKYRYVRICKHCVLEGNITIINSKFFYKYHGQNICKLCAEESILRELKLRGFDKRLFANFKKVLNRSGDLDKVISMMDPKFDPLSNSNLTLFDKVELGEDKNIPKIAIDRLKIPNKFKNILDDNNDKFLLPIQYLAIKNGLLKDKDLLVVSATGSGKTLVGELAGVPKALKGEKFVFLTPLVALANQKYGDFKNSYDQLGLKTSIKVGMNRINAKGHLKIKDSNIHDSDIIVGTYEGIDFLIRSGKSDSLNKLGVVLIDEIHTLDDPERGVRLNGLIRRLKKLFPKTQIIGLSATVKNQKQLAQEFDLNLVEYNIRPVPLERHITFVSNEIQRRNIIKKLILKEFNTSSSKGFKGQSIIFTNSRRKTHQIAKFLTKKGIVASPYHSGIPFFKKDKIEKDFANGKIAAVVTTAALAAGVDFPASQVIFESLLMGNKWLTPNEFHQMLGRAGRVSYHDRGIIYLIPEVGNKFDGENEESIAINLLESDVDKININYSVEDTSEQILADISSGTIKTLDELEKFYKSIPIPVDLEMTIDLLLDYNLIKILNPKHTKNSNNKKSKINNPNNKKKITFNELISTKYGKAVSTSFLSIEDGELIKNSLNKISLSYKNKIKGFKNNKTSNNQLKTQYNYFNKKYINKNKNRNNNTKSNINDKNINTKSNIDNENINTKSNTKNNKNKTFYKDIDFDLASSILEIAINLESFNNAFLSPNLHKQIVNVLKVNFSTRLFSESTLDIISSGETISKLDSKYQDALLKIQTDFLRCECKDKPFCNCLEKGISRLIMEDRLLKRDPVEISQKLFKLYQIQIYPGDIFSWLDMIVRLLDAVKRIANAFNLPYIVTESKKLVKLIEN
ncbi:DUF5814 domain-containing protein [Methanobrevibacter filiformis]|nr:DUF5814 domain-containing protein [Methanobrevibacter filiformis]